METKKNLLLILILSLSLIPDTKIKADCGGGIAAGVIGGFGLGAIIGSAAARPRDREVVYVQNEYPISSCRSSSCRGMSRYQMEQKARELDNWERELALRERELDQN